MKKVLFILHIPPPVHGSSIVGKNIKESILINESFDTKYINLLVSRTVNETGKPQLVKLLRFLKVVVKVFATMLKHRPHVCYLALTTTGAAFYKDVLLVFIMKLFGVKRVYHLHNKGVCDCKKRLINNVLYKYVFNGANVIMLSKLLYSDIDEFVPESKLHICPNGVIEPVGFIPRLPRVSTSKPRILFLSNLIESKGVFVLLEACAILVSKGYDFECNFIGAVGDINEEMFYKKVQDLNLNKYVNYLGKKYGEEKWQNLNSSDIFVFPTYFECFPLVLLEAMCAGLPVVSTYEGGIPEIVEDGKTGFLVPQLDSQELASKIEVLLTNSDLRISMGLAGREKYESVFTINAFEKRIKTIIQKVIE